MKNLIWIIIFTWLSGSIYAQRDNTLFNNHTRNGFFVAPLVEYSDLKNDLSTSLGGGFGFITGDFFFGLYGLGLTDYDAVFEDDFDKLTLGHGGLWLGYTYPQTSVIHPFSSIKIGWGGANFEIINKDLEYDDSFLVVTPEIGLEFNVFRWFRISATGGYRFINGMNGVPDFTEEDLETWTGTLTFRIGGFGREHGNYHHYNHNYNGWW